MAPGFTATRSEVKATQVKCKGILEPRGRVKGFRVEIRPPSSSKKIWVGTFDTRDKAKRAYDAAVYLTGKETYYFEYPEGYFSSRPSSPSKEDVQIQAKIFAEKTDDLKENVASRLGASSKAGQAKNVGSERTSLNTAAVKKVVGKMNSPLDSSMTQEELDQSLQAAEYLEIPTPLEWNFFDCLFEQFTEKLEESKVGSEKSAHDGGFTTKQDITKSLSDCPLSAPYDIPATEDESLYLPSNSPWTVSSKRKRGVSQETEFFTNYVDDLGFLQSVPADEDDWTSYINGSLV